MLIISFQNSYDVFASMWLMFCYLIEVSFSSILCSSTWHLEQCREKREAGFQPLCYIWTSSLVLISLFMIK